MAPRLPVDEIRCPFDDGEFEHIVVVYDNQKDKTEYQCDCNCQFAIWWGLMEGDQQ